MKNQIKFKYGSSKKVLITSLMAFTLSFASVAQDRITLHNGTEIYAKVTEITFNEVKYKSPDNLEGPTRIILKSEVYYIKYENGDKEVYKEEITSAKKPYNYLVSDTGAFFPKVTTKFGGPRFGFTYITLGTTSHKLTQEGKNPFITQLGWQFETRLFTVDNGPSGIIEFIPMAGGMEQGLFLPSASLLIGLRGASKNSFEFAVGPNLSVAGLGMVFAAGTNFKSGNINFPVNLAFVPSVGTKKTIYDEATQTNSSVTVQTGFRISLTVGFNSRKR